MNKLLAHVQIDIRNERGGSYEKYGTVGLALPSEDDIYARLMKEAGEEAVKARELWSRVLAAEPFFHKK